MISDVYNNLAQSNKSILHKYLELYEKEINKTEGTEEKIDNIQHEITVLEQKRDKLLDYNMGGYISDAEFLSRNKVFTQQIAEKKANLEQFEKHETSFQNRIDRSDGQDIRLCKGNIPA